MLNLLVHIKLQLLLSHINRNLWTYDFATWMICNGFIIFWILAVWSRCSNFLDERSIEAAGDDTAAVDNWSGGENSLVVTQIQMGSCLFVSCLLLPRSHAIPRRMKDRNSRQQGIWRLSSHCGSQQREDCGIIHIGVSLKVWLICWFPLLNSSRSMSKRN